MYQTVGHQIVVCYAKCMGVPLFRRRIQGSTRHQELNYKMTPGDEVEDMFILLSEIKRQVPSITAVSSGAIASDYQRLRVESVCSRLGLISLAYLWKQDQGLLFREMVTNGVEAITVKVAAMGLHPLKHLGKEIAYLEPYLHKLKDKYGINVCGEGGEYETLTLDCPLFISFRIVLDEFKIVLHSSDSIAPVGVLHPLKFHLENKGPISLNTDDDNTSNIDPMIMGSVCEVEGECRESLESEPEPIDKVSVEFTDYKSCISSTEGENTFSICCWLQNSCKTSSGLQEDLKVVLGDLELRLLDNGLGWEHVLYIHLYIADMNDFALANETYVRFITEEKCHFGVPSRSTIELPLLQMGLGRAYVEILVTKKQNKRVLHVRSISSWAPSCIGPYSQATLQNEILHMAGQLGLNPSTMSFCQGGPTAELKQALENSEAVAKSFNHSISISTIQFTIYCSPRIPLSERKEIQKKIDMFLEEIQLNKKSPNALKPIFLYVLVPDLPKQAFVEVKPILYVEQDMEIENAGGTENISNTRAASYWGFQHSNWHRSCFQKCIVQRKICGVVINITNELSLKIGSESLITDQKVGAFQNYGQMASISRFCVYLFDTILVENEFSWEDVSTLRLYVPTTVSMRIETLSAIFRNAFNEFSEMTKRLKNGEVPIFNLVPVLGAGRYAESMDEVITCELFGQKA